MTLKVLLTDRAELHVRAIDVWWQEHRPTARHLFREELAAALDALRSVPLSGRRYPLPRARDARRFLLRTTRYHVYYRVSSDAVTVLAVWSALRGRGPDLGHKS